MQQSGTNSLKVDVVSGIKKKSLLNQSHDAKTAPYFKMDYYSLIWKHKGPN
jgi:hypothetical protein